MVTLHHLTPKQKGGTAEDRTPLCRPCHKQLHATFDNRELARHYADLAALRAAPKLQSFLTWIKKQKAGRNFRTILSNDHPRRRRR
jgi:5-methylcytosine-specific restriction protein A